MEWKDLQPIATILAAIIGGAVTAIITLKLQNKKRNDDIDLKAFDHSLTKRFKEFEQNLLQDNSYLSEKGKGLATKEDIEEITRKVEAIKNEFVTPTEILKWQLSKKTNLYKIQAEKEFEVYSKIWDSAINLRFSLEQLRPAFDYSVPNEQKRERWLNKYSDVVKVFQNLNGEIEKHRPFYPNELYLQLQELMEQVNEEIIDFEFSLDEKQEKMSLDGYKRGRENLNKIRNHLNKLCELMRIRISDS